MITKIFEYEMMVTHVAIMEHMNRDIAMHSYKTCSVVHEFKNWLTLCNQFQSQTFSNPLTLSCCWGWIQNVWLVHSLDEIYFRGAAAAQIFIAAYLNIF